MEGRSPWLTVSALVVNLDPERRVHAANALTKH